MLVQAIPFPAIITGSPDTDVIIPAPGALNGWAVVVHVWRNVDTSSPFDVAATISSSPNTRSSDPPPITPVTAGAQIIPLASSGGSGGAFPNPGGLNNYFSAGSPGDDRDCGLAISSVPWSGSGAYDPPVHIKGSSSTVGQIGVTMALRPAEGQTLAFVGGKAVADNGTASPISISLTDLTGGIDSAPDTGDFVLFVFGQGSDGNIDMTLTSAGWTEYQDLWMDESIDHSVGINYKFMG